MDASLQNLQQFPFDNSYARLPERFYARLDPTPVQAPELLTLNHDLARHLNLDPEFLASPEGIKVLAGNQVPEGAEPLAMAYAGQQFGGWVPQLGDGRALLLGEVIDTGGLRRYIHFKGSGRTPFSRSGDGRAWIGPVLREHVVSEAMAALNVPTTRSLAAVATGEPVYREDILPGALIIRIAGSLVRVGTFQFFAARQDIEALQMLADYVIERHYPQAKETDNPYLGLLQNVIERQASLIAKWMAIGFIHGVMNTDNVSISGETIDYGPCAFMDHYHPDTVFSSIDYMGRYSYQNQPSITQWNLASLASSLLPLIHSDEDIAIKQASSAVDTFEDLFKAAWTSEFQAKLGLSTSRGSDDELARELLGLMTENRADFTLTFRRLCDLPGQADPANEKQDQPLNVLFDDPQSLHEWTGKWRYRLAQENSDDATRQAAMRAKNPAYIPRNHRIEQVISAALQDDLEPFNRLNTVLSRPFEDQPDNAQYQAPPEPDEVVRETFCGT